MGSSFIVGLKSTPFNVAVIETDQGDRIGALETIGPEHASDARLLNEICEWHNRAIDFYSDTTEWTASSTGKWLQESMIQSDSRVLFFVRNEAGSRVGFCGLSKISMQSAEVYDIVRGAPGGHARLLPYAQITMLRLGFYGMALHSIEGNVHSDNIAARRMGRFVGFEERHSSNVPEPCLHSSEESRTADRTKRRGSILLRITSRQLEDKHPRLTGLPAFHNIYIDWPQCKGCKS
jgi:hypothetical protein